MLVESQSVVVSAVGSLFMPSGQIQWDVKSDLPAEELIAIFSHRRGVLAKQSRLNRADINSSGLGDSLDKVRVAVQAQDCKEDAELVQIRARHHWDVCKFPRQDRGQDVAAVSSVSVDGREAVHQAGAVDVCLDVGAGYAADAFQGSAAEVCQHALVVEFSVSY
jgi:hypothetical protein